jgi:sulfatase maturation enzyme AslB (radical SAM superfamily)
MTETVLSAEKQPEEYHSCEYIEGGIVFYPNRISACCVSHGNGHAGQPRLTEFAGGGFPIAKIQEWRTKTIEAHKRGEFIPDCKGCPLLVKRAWGKARENSVHMITIAHYTHCNLRCGYCYTVLRPDLNIKPKQVYDLLPIFKDLIDTGALSPKAEIRFSGGEPTILGEFEDLLDLVSAYGPRIRIYTNAVVRSEAILRALAKRRVELVLGIDAGTDDVYKAVKGRNVNNQVWGNVAAYVGIDPDNCWAKMIVRKENIDDVVPFVERCIENGVRKVYYDLDATLLPTAERKAEDIYIDTLARLKYECEKNGIETSCAEVGVNSFSGDEVIHRVEAAYDRIARDDDEAGRRIQVMREMEQQGIDWKLYAHGMKRLGIDFATTLDAALARA